MSINRLFLIFLAILVGGKILAAFLLHLLETENNSMGLVIVYLAAYYSYQVYTNKNKSIIPAEKKWSVMFGMTAIETVFGAVMLYLTFGAADQKFADIAIPALSISAILSFVAIFISFYFIESAFKKEQEKQSEARDED